MEELTLTGAFGQILFDGNTSTRIMSLPIQTATILFEKVAITMPNLAANLLGLYSFAQIDGDGTARFASFGTPKHLFQAKGNTGCLWRPKGRISMYSDDVALCPIKYQGEICPDVFWDTCFEAIFGAGNDIENLLGTPAGQKMFKTLVEKVHEGLGNSYWELAEFGQHPLIADANANRWYTENPLDWADFVDQQEACAGHMTLVDEKKAEGIANYNVTISEDDVDGDRYIGDALAKIDEVIGRAKGEFAILNKKAVTAGNYPVIRISSGIFSRVREQIMLKFNTIPQSMHYFITGQMNVNGARILPGVIIYEGYALMEASSWSIFDSITGTITHRILMGAPGVFGLAHDVKSVKQFDGMGMRITQHLEDPWGGKIFMSTNQKMASAILDENFIINASLTLVPE